MYEMYMEEVRRLINNIAKVFVVSAVNHDTFSCTLIDEKGLQIDNAIWITQKASSNSVWFPPQVGETVLAISPDGELGTSFIVGPFHNQLNLPPCFDRNEHTVKYRDGGKEIYNTSSSSKSITTGGEEGSLSITTGAGQTTIIANKDEIDLDIQDVKITINPSTIVLTSGSNVVTMDNTNNTTTLTNGQNTIRSDQTSISIQTPTNTIVMNQSMVSITSNTSIDLNAPIVNITSPIISANGNLTLNGIVLGTHTHSGVEVGPGSSGPPNS